MAKPRRWLFMELAAAKLWSKRDRSQSMIAQFAIRRVGRDEWLKKNFMW